MKIQIKKYFSVLIFIILGVTGMIFESLGFYKNETDLTLIKVTIGIVSSFIMAGIMLILVRLNDIAVKLK